MSDSVLAALALVLVFEGLLPLFSPKRWRRVMEQVLQFSDGQLRFLGLCAIAVGVTTLILLS